MKTLLLVGIIVCGLVMEVVPTVTTGGRGKCAQSDDAVGCWAEKAMEKVGDVLKQDRVEVTDSMSIVRNTALPTESEAKGSSGYLDQLAAYVRSHDVIISTQGSTFNISPRSIDQGKIDISLKYDDDVEEEARSKIKHGIKHGIKKIKKSKLKKLIVPIVIILMLKAITFIPLIIALLGIKAWNALQLGFGSFLVSFSIAVFQLCQKLTDHWHKGAPIVHAAPWQAARTRRAAQDMAYRAHAL